MSKVTVFGTGQWGSTMAQVLSDAGNHVLMWGRNSDVVEEINLSHLPKRVNVIRVNINGREDEKKWIYS